MPLPETGQPVQGELAPAPATAPPVIPQAYVPPAAPQVQPPAPQGAPGAGSPAASATPAVADDGDLIEKEWVLKAKAIVERTRGDPHKQTKALHAFKADYMKKRYNKAIEAVEEYGRIWQL